MKHMLLIGPKSQFDVIFSIYFFPGYYEIAEYLLSKGANVDPLCQDGESPLFCAAIQGNERIVTLLLKHNADVISSCFPAHLCSFPTVLYVLLSFALF